MSLTIVIGGQFGSEGKGKITAHLSRNYDIDVCVRCGGPNSGHTINIKDKRIVLRQIPAGIVNPKTKLFISAGCLINMDVLMKEIEIFNLKPHRLKIDGNAIIIDQNDIKGECDSKLKDRIGSTCTGVGFATAKRILRNEGVKLARDVPQLTPFIANIPELLMNCIEQDKKVIIEGTQGFGLSVYHSPYYPFTTGRDTTASSFLSEVGLSPLLVSNIIMVIRTFPIRVGGNSGPLKDEIDWKTIQIESGYPYKIEEYTTVTNRLRRVGRFDIDIVKKAVLTNKPTAIALMGVDYLDFANKDLVEFNNLTSETKIIISNLENKLGVTISFIGTGPTDYEIIDRNKFEKEQKGEINGRRLEKFSLC
jgi:adenylosuccinate synthase